MQKPHPIAEFLIFTDDCNAADHVGVAVEIFGRRMHDDIETEFERPLNPRRGECVVGYGKNFVFARDLRDRFQVDNFQERIARGLDPNHARVLLDRLLQTRRVR